MSIRRLSKKDIPMILDCLGEGKKVSLKDRKIVQSYFEKKWLGYGTFTFNYDPVHLRYFLVAYCFVKNPKTRPETMTVVRSEYRNKGFATALRNWVLEQREFKGHIVYSSVKITNPTSLKSLIKSGFSVFDVTKDGYIQLMKVLPYK